MNILREERNINLLFEIDLTEGEKMVKKSKVGSTGRFGARYGRKAKRTVKDIEDKMHAKHICPKCDRPGVKRTHAGIWKCKKCGNVFTGGAYVPSTPMGKVATRNIKRIVGGE